MKRVIGFVAFLMFFCGMSVAHAGFFGDSLTGKKAPEFKLEALRGGGGGLEDWRKGGKAIVFFWSTWCPHCQEQLREVKQRKAEIEKNGISIILVNIGDQKKLVQKFLDANGYDFNVLLDVNSYVAEMYQVVGIPTIVLVGADGVIRGTQYSLPSDYAERLK